MDRHDHLAMRVVRSNVRGRMKKIDLHFLQQERDFKMLSYANPGRLADYDV